MQQDAKNKLYLIGMGVLTVVAIGIVLCGLGYVSTHIIYVASSWLIKSILIGHIR